MAYTYHQLLEASVKALGISSDAVHVHIGIALWLASALVLRRSLRSPLPLLVVLAAELANEVLDRLFWGQWQDDTLADVAHTSGWPLVLCLALRGTKGLR